VDLKSKLREGLSVSKRIHISNAAYERLSALKEKAGVGSLSKCIEAMNTCGCCGKDIHMCPECQLKKGESKDEGFGPKDY
jgi:hypothetical protein